MVPNISIEAGGEIGAKGITWGCEGGKAEGLRDQCACIMLRGHTRRGSQSD